MPQSPHSYWYRSNLRLADHVGLSRAAATRLPIIPVFIHCDIAASHGAAPKWRLGLVVEHVAAGLEAFGSRLILRRDALEVLQDLAREADATSIHWSRV